MRLIQSLRSPDIPVGRLAGVSIFLLGALGLTLPSGYSVGAFWLLITAMVGLVTLPRCASPLPLLVRLVLAVMVLYAAFWMVDAGLRGGGLREFDRPSRFLFAAISLLALTRIRVSQTWLWSGLAVGASATGVLAIWQKFFLSMDRATGFTQTVQFGNLSMLFGLLCAAGLFWAQGHTRLKAGWITLLCVGAMLGVIASLLSGTRGAWVAPLACVPVFLLAMNGADIKRRALAVGIVVILTAAGAAYLLPQTGISDRVGHALTDWERYAGGGVAEGSLSMRIEMWRGAWRLFEEKPLTGWGETGYIQRLGELGEAGVISWEAAGYTHAHNELLNAVAKKGLIGGLILYSLYILPLAWFASQFKNASPAQLGIAVAGATLPVCYMASGMTQVSFNHNSGVMIYAFMLAILVGFSVQLSEPKRRG